MVESTLPTPEKAQKLLDRWLKVKEKVDKLVKKKIDPIYFDMAGKISDRCRQSPYLPWIMERATNGNVDMARIFIALPDPHRDPSWGREHLGVTDQFAKDLGLDRETVDRYLKELTEKGFVNPTRSGYQCIRSSARLQEVAFHPKYPRDNDLADITLVWHRFEIQGYRNILLEGQDRSSAVRSRGTIRPRWKSIKDVPGVLPIEDAREILKTKRRWGVVDCPCMEMDRGIDCGVTMKRCMVTDASADYIIRRGHGTELTLVEALDLYDELGKYPLVNLARGTDAKTTDIGCICHWDCCLSMVSYYLPGGKFTIMDWLGQNRFRATVDPEKCIGNGCRRCVDEMCQFPGSVLMKYYPEFGEERAYIDEKLCMGCGLCVERCPVSCMGMKLVEPPEFVLEADAKRANIGMDSGFA